MPKEKNWLQRRLIEPLLSLLRQGMSPARLALCVAIGIVIGNIPILGVSTIICTFIALIFRLNLPTMQLVQGAMAPTQVLLIIPFVRVGRMDFTGAAAGPVHEVRSRAHGPRAGARRGGAARCDIPRVF